MAELAASFKAALNDRELLLFCSRVTYASSGWLSRAKSPSSRAGTASVSFKTSVLLNK